MSSTYSLPSHTGNVPLFRASERLDTERWDETLWWNRLATVETHEIPGNHYTLIQEPCVRMLARELKAAVLKALR